MTMMDERVAERRRGVSEDRARQRLKWILVAIVVVALAVAGVWLVRSPLLSVSEIEISGAEQSNPIDAVRALDTDVGTAMIDVRTGAITTEIEADPWVAQAQVSLSWPQTLVIEIVEHVPTVLVSSGTGFVWTTEDGWIVTEAERTEGHPIVAIDAGDTSIGEVTEDPFLLGGLVFVTALPPDLASDAVVSAEDGGLVAVVAGHRVRLGRPVDLAVKAVVLEELLATGLEEGAVIDLIAPMRPAVANPQPQVEAEE